MIDVDLCIRNLKALFPSGAKIVAAMSGGVDSSVTATLVKRAGFEVVGVMLSMLPKSCDSTCFLSDVEDARKVANYNNFEFHVLDYTAEFKSKVVDNFVDNYAAGRTPSPCSQCNKYIKFGKLIDYAKSIGAFSLVSGHYIKKQGDDVLRGSSISKDQSYFLALTSSSNIAFANFPLGDFEKSDTRRLAEDLGVEVAKKRESQDLCFIRKGDYRDFLMDLRPELFKRGFIKTVGGEIVGEHSGLAGYTVGQRKGINIISRSGADSGPRFVIRLDVADNAIIVGTIDQLKRRVFKLSDVNLLTKNEAVFDKVIWVQVRLRGSLMLAKFDFSTSIVELMPPEDAVSGDGWNETPIAPGQVCAFYDGEKLVGGGVIDATLG